VGKDAREKTVIIGSLLVGTHSVPVWYAAAISIPWEVCKYNSSAQSVMIQRSVCHWQVTWIQMSVRIFDELVCILFARRQDCWS
jgi:hypothetical protein